MSLSTHGHHLVVTRPEWAAQEQVKLRTVYTKGDKTWINAQAMRLESDTEGNMVAAVDMEMNVAATVAKMIISWTLTRDVVKKINLPDGTTEEEPVYNEDGTIMQEPRPLSNPTDIFARLKDIQALADSDADYIFNQHAKCIAERDAAQAPKTEQEKQIFTSDASGPSSTTVK